MNLIMGLHKQIARAEELKKLYDALPGGAGVFGAEMIRRRIEQAEASIGSGDVMMMVAAHLALEALE